MINNWLNFIDILQFAFIYTQKLSKKATMMVQSNFTDNWH